MLCSALVLHLACWAAPPQDQASLPELVQRYQEDRRALGRLYPVPLSSSRHQRFERFYQDWTGRLAAVDFAALDQGGRIDWLLLRNALDHELRAIGHERQRDAEVASLLSFAPPLVELCEARLRRELADPRAAAEVLAAAAQAVETLKEEFSGAKPEVRPTVAARAAERCSDLAGELADWYRFYAGYHPEFGWWAEQPWRELEPKMRDYQKFLREKLGGLEEEEEDGDQIVGDPIGRPALLDELAAEMIPYTPEELIGIAEREFAWCRARWLEAARELGCGEDWRAALEQVKLQHVSPGEQPRLILDLADEAVAFLESRDLVTIPELCKESWRMEMMSPERQKYTPYFTGGEVISISFPTASMSHEDKLMSLRGNNLPFCRATVHHELIPGHHLQGFMSRRHQPHRAAFHTAFFSEGWALYWEMLLWDLDFPPAASDRVGMLFWRKHRCARIVFSLKFQLGEWTAQQCVDYLVDEVGHERRGAEAEVRRSVQGGYGPLYQCAYMLGGLQLRALHRELVQSGRMSNRAFHDAVLRENAIPVELIRAALTGQELTPDFQSTWRFDGD